MTEHQLVVGNYIPLAAINTDRHTKLFMIFPGNSPRECGEDTCLQ